MAAINESLTYDEFLDKQGSCCHQESDQFHELNLFTDRQLNPKIAVFNIPRTQHAITGQGITGQYNVLDIKKQPSTRSSGGRGGGSDLKQNYNDRKGLMNLMDSLQAMFSERDFFLADFKKKIPSTNTICLNLNLWLDVARDYNGVCNLLRNAKDKFPIVVWDQNHALDCLHDGEVCFKGFSIVDPFNSSDGGNGTWTGLELTSLASIKSALSKDRHYLCRQDSHFFFHEGWDIKSRSDVNDHVIDAAVQRLSESLFLKHFNK
jgi:hypothetical protein